MAKWSDPNLIPAQGGGYMKLRHGENRIRIVSEPAVFGKHFINKKSIVCIGKEEGCEACNEGDRSKPSWLLWVIDRADGNIKMLEAGYQIISQIQKLAVGTEYGFDLLPAYDIFIQKEGEGLETEYAVTPARKDTPLTDKEKAEILELKSPLTIIAEKKEKEAF